MHQRTSDRVFAAAVTALVAGLLTAVAGPTSGAVRSEIARKLPHAEQAVATLVDRLDDHVRAGQATARAVPGL